jgi:hypothetical protein
MWFGQTKGKINRVNEDGEIVYVYDEKRKIKTQQNRDPKKSPVYIENHHQGIIDRDLFNKVQDILNKNQEDVSRRGRPSKGKFTGLLKCGHCGSNLTFDSQSKFPHYRCPKSKGGSRSKKENGTPLCPGGSKMIREEDVETILKEEVRDVFSQPTIHRIQIEKVIELLKEREFTNSNTFENDLKEEYETFNKLEKRLDNLLENPHTTETLLTKVGQQLEEQKRKIELLRNEQTKLDNNPMFEIFDKVDKKYQSVKSNPLEDVQKLTELTFGDYLEQICSGVVLSDRIDRVVEKGSSLKTDCFDLDLIVDLYRVVGWEVSSEWEEMYGRDLLVKTDGKKIEIPFQSLPEDLRRQLVLDLFSGHISYLFSQMTDEQLDGFRSLIGSMTIQWTEKSSVDELTLMETGRLGDRFSYKRQINVPTDFSVSVDGQNGNNGQGNVVMSF